MSLEAIYNAVLAGNAPAAKSEVQAALDAGLSAETILNEACIPAMTEVGRLFEIGEKFVPEMLIAARAMSAATAILKPLLADEGVEEIGTVIIGTVAGDLHDIGKNLVGMMCEGAGFEVIDVGFNAPPEKFVTAVKEHKPEIVGMSALLTTTMRAMAHTIRSLEEAGLRDRVKVMVGGAPVDAEFAERIGADGYGSNAVAAAEMAKRWVGVAWPG